MANLDVWRDYVTVINAARLNAIRDRIITNEGNISYQQTLINANTTSIYTNSNNIDNLSATKLPRDGSLSMTGELVCGAGLKANTIDAYSGDTITFQKDIEIDGNIQGISGEGLLIQSEVGLMSPKMQFYSTGGANPGMIELRTPGAQYAVPRLQITSSGTKADFKIVQADLVPYSDDQDIGRSTSIWRKVYAKEGIFDLVTVPRTMPFYLESPSSSDKYLLGAGTVSTMYQFNTTVTLIGYKLMMLTSASNGYIKVTIDDANGWSYEKTYSLGSAGGYRYNESFTHLIETDNGIQLKISNCSQISSTSIVLEYK